MTYAIVETGGKQFWVEPGRFYDVELLDLEPNNEMALEQVLLLNHDGQVTVGHPYVVGAVVRGRVLRHRRTRKVIVYKMKPKKKTRKKKGHRQHQTRLLIESITLNGTVLATADDQSSIAPIEEIAAPATPPALETVSPDPAAVE